MCGVGINDANYIITKRNKEENQTIVWRCNFYRTWQNMLVRCYLESCHKIKPKYIGCSVHKEWLTFSNFKSWMEKQDWNGKQLDKDILIPGNKVYSAETCVFIGSRLNKFLTDSGASRGEWPIGVSAHSGKFQASCNNPFTKQRECLGHFKTPEEAHLVWKTKKHEHACKLAELETDSRIKEALVNRFKP